jgi:drug/metabolite transporter (DMT)-like permease
MEAVEPVTNTNQTDPTTTGRPVTGILQALAAAALFGINAPLSKLLLAPSALGQVAPIPMAALLYLGSGVGALILLALQRSEIAAESEARLQRADAPWLIGALLAGGVAAPIVLMFSLRITPGATASLLLNFEGVATTLLAALAFGESIGSRVWGAVGLITGASAILSWEAGGAFGVSVGALGVLAACVLWGIDNNFTRNISAKNPLTIVTVKGLGAGLFSLILALIVGQPLPNIGAALGAMALGSVSYGLSITLFIRALRDLGTARTSALFSSAPFIGSLISFVILREPVSPQFLLALPLMLTGTLLLVTERHAHRHQHRFMLHEHRHRHDDEHHDHEHAPDEIPPSGWHSHPHEHRPQTHTHPHAPDLHHRHTHEDAETN